jgi:hypothetical protein
MQSWRCYESSRLAATPAKHAATVEVALLAASCATCACAREQSMRSISGGSYDGRLGPVPEASSALERPSNPTSTMSSPQAEHNTHKEAPPDGGCSEGEGGAAGHALGTPGTSSTPGVHEEEGGGGGDGGEGGAAATALSPYVVAAVAAAGSTGIDMRVLRTMRIAIPHAEICAGIEGSYAVYQVRSPCAHMCPPQMNVCAVIACSMAKSVCHALHVVSTIVQAAWSSVNHLQSALIFTM